MEESANQKKQVKVQIPAASRRCAKELTEEVNADREAHGKKAFEDDDEPSAAAKKRRDNTSKKKLARRKKEKLHTVKRRPLLPTLPASPCISVKRYLKMDVCCPALTNGPRPGRAATSGGSMYMTSIMTVCSAWNSRP